MSSPDARTTAACAAVIVLCGLAAYHNCFECPLVFDDFASIEKNPTIRSLWPIGRVLSPPQNGEAIQNRPIPNFTLAINYALHGTRVFGYHLVNLLFHLLSALVLFALIRRTLATWDHAATLGRGATGLALTASVFWTVHPLQTEAVSYIIQRPEIMTGLFYLLTLYALVRGAGSRHPARWWGAAVLFCALGMGCKEVMVTAPVMALLYDRCFLAGSFREALRRRKWLYAGLAASWLVLAAILIDASGQRGVAAGFGHGMSAWEYLRTQFGAILLYLKLSVWPATLIFDRGYAVEDSMVKIVGQGLVLLLLGGATLGALFFRPRLGFLGAWFLVILSPSSSIVPLVSQTVAEKRMNLPLAGVIVLAVVGGARLFRRLPAVKPVVRYALVAAIGLSLLFRTISRNADYRSGIALWRVTVADNPGNPRAHHNLGIEYGKAGQYRLSLQQLDRAIELDPHDAEAYHSRSITRGKLGDREGAWLDIRRALKLEPNHVEALASRGMLRALQGDLDGGIRDLDRAIRLNPRSGQAYYLRSVLHGRRGDLERLLEDSTRVIELFPDHALAHSNRGMAYGRKGQYDRALADLDRAIQLDPGCARAYHNRAIVYRELGKDELAIRDYQSAVRLDPRLAGSRGAIPADPDLLDW